MGDIRVAVSLTSGPRKTFACAAGSLICVLPFRLPGHILPNFSHLEIFGHVHSPALGPASSISSDLRSHSSAVRITGNQQRRRSRFERKRCGFIQRENPRKHLDTALRVAKEPKDREASSRSACRMAWRAHTTAACPVASVLNNHIKLSVRPQP
jgi:hypothetical protein